MDIAKFDKTSLQAICDVLGDTEKGLTGSEIGDLLDQTEIDDIEPLMSKRYRIFEALVAKQEEDACGDHVISFIERSMNPIRYTRNREIFEDRKEDLNFVLDLIGYKLLKNGKMIKIPKTDVTDLETDVNQSNNDHNVPDKNLELYKCNNCDVSIPPESIKEQKVNVCPSCGCLYPYTLKCIENYFRIIQISSKLKKAKRLFLKSEIDSSVREAIIVFEFTIKETSKLDLTGSNLMAKAFEFEFDKKTNAITQDPKIKLNPLTNQSMRNEQQGIKLSTMGFMQGIRNIYMHTEGSSKIYHALQIITMVDFFLKQIDGDNLIGTEIK